MTRKYFGTDGIRGKVGEYPITPDFMLKLGWALGSVIRKKHKRTKVLIGKDTRISGYMFEAALEAGLTAAGINIELVGPMPTPAIAYLARTFRAQAGIVISASHNPYYDNGVKFFSSDGFKLPDEVEAQIEAALEEDMQVIQTEKIGRAKRVKDAEGRYIEFCKGSVENEVNFRKLKIVLDCANGATYRVAPHVFTELGADVIELAVDPDGLNINQGCGATNLKMLSRVVVAESADVGIAFDGDGDRVMMVDHLGNVVDGDELLFIIANQMHSKHPIAGVVGTLMSNFGLELAFQRLNMPFVRTKVGDRYVMTELQRLGWRIGGEGSGHLVCLDKTTTGDGIISALQILQAMFYTEKSLFELKQGMHKLPQILINVPAHKKVSIEEDNKIQTAIKSAEHTLQNTGRVLLRPSGTEPVVRVMVEGENHDLVKKLAQGLADVVQETMN